MPVPATLKLLITIALECKQQKMSSDWHDSRWNYVCNELLSEEHEELVNTQWEDLPEDDKWALHLYDGKLNQQLQKYVEICPANMDDLPVNPDWDGYSVAIKLTEQLCDDSYWFCYPDRLDSDEPFPCIPFQGYHGITQWCWNPTERASGCFEGRCGDKYPLLKLALDAFALMRRSCNQNRVVRYRFQDFRQLVERSLRGTKMVEAQEPAKKEEWWSLRF